MVEFFHASIHQKRVSYNLEANVQRILEKNRKFYLQ